jgi:hypothetical protein
MLIDDFFIDGKWDVEYPGMSTFEILNIFGDGGESSICLLERK